MPNDQKKADEEWELSKQLACCVNGNGYELNYEIQWGKHHTGTSMLLTSSLPFIYITAFPLIETRTSLSVHFR
jgi:hypothetical protein